MEPTEVGDARREPDLDDAVRVLLAEQAGFTRYQLSQLQARRGASVRARHLEFDESGLPVHPSGPGLVERVARLLTPR